MHNKKTKADVTVEKDGQTKQIKLMHLAAHERMGYKRVADATVKKTAKGAK